MVWQGSAGDRRPYADPQIALLTVTKPPVSGPWVCPEYPAAVHFWQQASRLQVYCGIWAVLTTSWKPRRGQAVGPFSELAGLYRDGVAEARGRVIRERVVAGAPASIPDPVGPIPMSESGWPGSWP